MGYLADGKPMAFFIRLTDKEEPEVLRLYRIFKSSRKVRTKKKIAKRIDKLVSS